MLLKGFYRAKIAFALIALAFASPCSGHLICEDGENFFDGCNECICQNGRISCTERFCNFDFCPSFDDSSNKCSRECLDFFDPVCTRHGNVCCIYGCSSRCVKPLGRCPKLSSPIGICEERCNGSNFLDKKCVLEGKFCCSNGCGHSCMDPEPEIPRELLDFKYFLEHLIHNYGKCPRPSNAGPGPCVQFCEGGSILDPRCLKNGQLCCSNGCGTECNYPSKIDIPSAFNLKERLQDLLRKYGTCPRLEPGSVGICTQSCFSCEEHFKLCCSNGCGRTCQYPVFNVPLPDGLLDLVKLVIPNLKFGPNKVHIEH